MKDHPFERDPQPSEHQLNCIHVKLPAVTFSKGRMRTRVSGTKGVTWYRSGTCCLGEAHWFTVLFTCTRPLHQGKSKDDFWDVLQNNPVVGGTVGRGAGTNGLTSIIITTTCWVLGVHRIPGFPGPCVWKF